MGKYHKAVGKFNLVVADVEDDSQASSKRFAMTMGLTTDPIRTSKHSCIWTEEGGIRFSRRADLFAEFIRLESESDVEAFMADPPAREAIK